MYEEMTYDNIMEQLLSNVPEDISVDEGSVIYTALSPIAYELEKAYIELDQVLSQTFADTADYDYLELRARERGLAPIAATYCKAKGVFNAAVPEGSRFYIGELTYISGEPVETETGFAYVMTCEEAGTIANGVLGELTPIDYIDDLEEANLTEILVAARDKEDVEDFRTRYFASFASHSFGGNVADYIEKISSIEGVGGVHIYPTWNGGGTVKAEIIGHDYLPASVMLVDTVQQIMCPTAGQGYGFAPIGHDFTCVSAEGVEITVRTTLTYGPGYNYEELETQINEAVESYFSELRKGWQAAFENTDQPLVVRIAEIESHLLAIQGVIDVTGTTLNDQEGNITLEVSQVPILKEVIC